ncbi:unnamed protein product [Orchesella dallaii]|uniref:Uncharacterized protein n=1 Tax=Orchesella dallaii TaxID=48710 RepID=A0ABP1QNS5_9HEXA
MIKTMFVLLTLFLTISPASASDPGSSPSFKLLKNTFNLGHLNHKISEIIIIYFSNEFQDNLPDLLHTISKSYKHSPVKLINRAYSSSLPSFFKHKPTRFTSLNNFPLVILERDEPEKPSKIINLLQSVFRPATINLGKYIIIRTTNQSKAQTQKNVTSNGLAPPSFKSLKQDSLRTIRDKMEIWTSENQAGLKVAIMLAYCPFCRPITPYGKLRNGNLLISAFDEVRGYVNYAPTFPNFSKYFHDVRLTYIFILFRQQDGTDKGFSWDSDSTERQLIQQGDFFNLMFKTMANGIHWDVQADDFIYVKPSLTKLVENGSLNLPKPPKLPWNAVICALPLFIYSEDLDATEIYNRNEATILATQVEKEPNTDGTNQLLVFPLVFLVPVVLLLRKWLLSTVNKEVFISNWYFLMMNYIKQLWTIILVVTQNRSIGDLNYQTLSSILLLFSSSMLGVLILFWNNIQIFTYICRRIEYIPLKSHLDLYLANHDHESIWGYRSSFGKELLSVLVGHHFPKKFPVAVESVINKMKFLSEEECAKSVLSGSNSYACFGNLVVWKKVLNGILRNENRLKNSSFTLKPYTFVPIGVLQGTAARFSKDFIFAPELKNVVSRIIQAGLFQYWSEGNENGYTMKHRINENSEENLNIFDIQVASKLVWYLCIGHSIAFGVHIIEILGANRTYVISAVLRAWLVIQKKVISLISCVKLGLGNALGN